MSGLRSKFFVVAACCSLVCLQAAVIVATESDSGKAVASATVRTSGISWQADVDYASAVLTVSGPDGSVVRKEFSSLDQITLSIGDSDVAAMGDGHFSWELQLAPVVAEKEAAALEAARAQGDSAAGIGLKRDGDLPTALPAVSGYFSVKGGSIVMSTAAEPPMRNPSTRVAPTADPTASLVSDADGATKDQVIADDLIVQSSLCVGFDCVNGESFGFDTIRLKENNTRIKFQDTSTTGSFPTTDWQLTANDSASGGANKFSIEDIDHSRIPFTIEANARNNALYVDDSGRVGFGTSTPVVELHSADGDTPTLRLEQNSSQGWSAQTWDVAGNESNFFIRDVTNGSKLPFRIKPGAPSNSLFIAADGNLGVGTASPTGGKIHIRDTTADSTLLYFENTTGQAIFQMVNGFGDQWAYRAQDNGFGINYAGNAGLEFRVAENGDIYVNSVMVHSSRELKENFRAVDGNEVLDRVAALPITEWNYKSDPASTRHIGPVAEDFQALFALNEDDHNVSLADLSGIALTSIQVLDAQARQRDALITRLEEENKMLSNRLGELERAVQMLMGDDKE